MRVLHAYNEPRSGGGSLDATRASIKVSRQHGLEVGIFTRSSRDLPGNLVGRLRAGLSAIYAPQSVRQFAAQLDSFRPDVVHINEVFPLVSPWILPLCTRHRIPVVMSCDDYHMTCPVRSHFHDGQICTRCAGGHEYWAVFRNCRDSLPESFTMALYNAMVRKFRLFSSHVSHYIAPSKFTRQWLIEKAQIDPACITVNAPIVDVPENVADPGVGSYLAFAGRFVPEKGIDVLLEAARLCRLPVCLSRREHFFSTVTLPPDVEVVITHSRRDLDAFYRGSRVVVVPGISFETFGIVGAEAMSHGIPVVVSRVGALAELVEDGVDGLCFEPGNSRDLAEKLRRLWADPKLCRQLGRAARQKATSLWGAERHFEHLMVVYEHVCGQQMSGAAGS